MARNTKKNWSQEELEGVLDAIFQGEVEVLRGALARGFDPDTRDSVGSSALSYAFNANPKRPDTPAARLLLERRADPSEALAAALANSHPAVVRFLLERGLDASAPLPDGRPPLHWVAESSDPRYIPAFLAAGATLDARGPDGRTALHAAVTCFRAGSMVRALLAVGAKADVAAEDGETPLHRCCERNPPDLRAARGLLDAGADPNREDGAGHNALTRALLGGHLELAALLRRRGAKDQPEARAALDAAAREHRARAEKRAEQERQSEANQRRAVAWFEARYGTSGLGRAARSEEDGAEGLGRAARMTRGRVRFWAPSSSPPSHTVVLPESRWTWARGQKPSAPGKRGEAVPSGDLEARLDAVDASLAEAGVALRRGAKAAALARAEKRLGCALPEDLRAWLKRHDGSDSELVADYEELLDLESAAQLHTETRRTHASFRKGWLPLTHDSGGSYRCLDLSPSSASFGKVLRYWTDERRQAVVAPSLLEFLENVYWGRWD